MTYPNREVVDVVDSIIGRVGIDTTTPAAVPDRDLWAALAEAGFTAIGIPENVGGSGGSMADAVTLAAAASAHGALTPVIEHTVLAGWLAASAGFDVESAIATIAVGDSRCALSDSSEAMVIDGLVTGVVHADMADVVVVLVEPAESGSPQLAVVSTSAQGITVDERTDLIGATVADLTFDSTPVLFQAPSPIGIDELQTRAALAYSAVMAASAGAIRDRTIRYVNERTQFGRPLSKFQAVQHRLAWLAALTALCEIAATAAVDASQSSSTEAAQTAIAAAKTVASSCAREITAAAHQLHGAIGFTAEHPLGRFTTSLWTWRERYGSEQDWAQLLAAQILDDGIDVWDVIVGEHTDAGGNA